jgi:hypothetical protein
MKLMLITTLEVELNIILVNILHARMNKKA